MNDYWYNRRLKNLENGEKEVISFYNELKEVFERAKYDITATFNDFYIKYSKDNKISYIDLLKKLNVTEIKDLNYFISKVYKGFGVADEEIKLISFKTRINRLKALEKQINVLLEVLYKYNFERDGEEFFKTRYKDSYYKTLYDIDIFNGFHSEFAQVNVNSIESLIKYPFNGANYSDRVWKQKAHLEQSLKESMITIIVQGKNPQTLSAEIAKKFKTKEYEAYRLLYTESTFFIEQGSLVAYKEDGVEEYEILATFDIKTSETCRDKDGKIYSIDEYVVGVTAPPFHPFCRTTTIPHFDEYGDGGRIARDAVTGKTYEIPADMKYREWYDEYVANDPKAIIEEKKLKNRYSDNKQYNKYKEVLGRDTPKSFDDFQELKYNNVKEWELVNDYIKSREINMISAFTSFGDFKKYKNIIDKDIVGIKTINKIQIKSQSKHFIERVLGTSYDPGKKKPRDGVNVDDILKTLIEPLKIKEEPKKNSHKFIGEKITITINPYTGKLIQCNPTDSELVRRLRNV